MASLASHNKALASLPEEDLAALRGERDPAARRIWGCTFHPSYGYEEFIEGLKPVPGPGGLTFQPQPGLFRRLSTEAAKRPDELFFLVLDEMNRGDVPRIFGELLTVLELDKRGTRVALPYSHEEFAVPRNVRIVATMNTADRSIALLDAALRRRFAAIELLPDHSVLTGAVAGDIALDRLLVALNRRLLGQLGHRGRNLQVGHAYFFSDGQVMRDFGTLRRVLKADVLPLLQEYCYDDPESLARIVGPDLYSKERHAFADELFDTGNEEVLRGVLAAWEPTVVQQPTKVEEPATSEEEETK
jgi:5-methylcytosine-specific restriction protein B